MRIGILTRNRESWSSQQLKQSVINYDATPLFFNFSDLSASISFKSKIFFKNVDLIEGLKSIIVRPIGRGSLEEIIFRLDLLHKLERNGVSIFNSPNSIELCVDKFHTLALLEENMIKVPRTFVTENPNNAQEAFKKLGGDVVIKPIFGSRGFGSTRVSDPNIADRIFKALSFHHQVIYVQEFIPHRKCDVRIFVLGNKVLAAMRRVGESWKTNVSQGATPLFYEPSEEIRDIALKSSNIVGCRIAGVDIIETDRGVFVIEINSQPGWKGLQSVTEGNISDAIIKYVIDNSN